MMWLTCFIAHPQICQNSMRLLRKCICSKAKYNIVNTVAICFDYSNGPSDSAVITHPRPDNEDLILHPFIALEQLLALTFRLGAHRPRAAFTCHSRTPQSRHFLLLQGTEKLSR